MKFNTKTDPKIKEIEYEMKRNKWGSLEFPVCTNVGGNTQYNETSQVDFEL